MNLAIAIILIVVALCVGFYLGMRFVVWIEAWGEWQDIKENLRRHGDSIEQRENFMQQKKKVIKEARNRGMI